MNYIIGGRGYFSALFRQLPVFKDCIIMTEEELKASTIYFKEDDIIYAPSESSIGNILYRMEQSSPRRLAIENLKDKYRCRQLLQEMYPDFNFKTIKLSDLPSELITEKVVIKPKKGFFSIGVVIVEPGMDLTKVESDITKGLKSQSCFGEAVLSRNDFIIEDFIPGEQEFAVDMFFDVNGNPVITNIYHHPYPKHREYFHILYYTNRELFDCYAAIFLKLFTSLNETLRLVSFPIHAEFKLHNGIMFPIEFNPLRYGGYGLGDLAYYAFGFHPVHTLFTGSQIDWDAIWSRYGMREYGWILAYNSATSDLSRERPDFTKFKYAISPVLGYIPIEYKTNPAFAIAYKELETGDKGNILALDLSDFFYRFHESSEQL